MLLALPCGRDPLDVHAQTRALKTGFITYLQQKQAAGIINVPTPPNTMVSSLFFLRYLNGGRWKRTKCFFYVRF